MVNIVYWVTIRTAAFKCFFKELSLIDAVILDIINQQTEHFDFCPLPKSLLAEMLNIKPASVFNTIKKLKEMGLVEKVYPSETDRRTALKLMKISSAGKKGEGIRTSCYRTTMIWKDYVKENPLKGN